MLPLILKRAFFVAFIQLGHRRDDPEGPRSRRPWRGARAAETTWRNEEFRITIVTHHGLPQTLGPTAPQCASAGRDRGILNKFPSAAYSGLVIWRALSEWCASRPVKACH